MKKILKYLPTFVFLMFVYVMAILFFVLPHNKYSSSEKRYLAEFPTLNSDTFFSGQFGEEYETYLSDHTAGRQFYVGLNSYYNLCLGNPLSNGIYHCDNGYLVNDPPVTDRLSMNIEIISEFANSSGLDTTMIMAPSSGYVMSDVLPNKHITYNNDEYFNLAKDTFAKGNVNFVDVRKDFKDAYNNGTQVYYKTDHHWTTNGAYLAYRSLSDSLNFTPNEKSHYDIKTYDGFYGTTYSSSGYWLTKPDKIEVWQSKSINENDVEVSITDNGEVSVSSTMFYLENLNDDDKYPVFLNGNRPYTVIKNKVLSNDADAKKLLVIKDSFAHSLVPFLADHYSEIVMIDMRYYKQSVSKLIEENDFDQMLFVYSIDNLATDADIAWIE